MGALDPFIRPCRVGVAPGIDLIGSIPGECLDPVMVFNAGRHQHLLTSHAHSYQGWRVHLSLALDSPDTRPVQPPKSERSLLSRKWVDSIIITRGWPHDFRGRKHCRSARGTFSGSTPLPNGNFLGVDMKYILNIIFILSRNILEDIR